MRNFLFIILSFFISTNSVYAITINVLEKYNEYYGTSYTEPDPIDNWDAYLAGFIATDPHNELTLFFPDGLYVIHNTISLRDNITILGQNNTILFATEVENYPIFYAMDKSNLHIKDIKFKGNYSIANS